ncbi:MAG: methyltransferase domain-containing protein [Alphaproteobacteria bacterium]|nr:methyltransferase domain-containing protein [Alphaproteobacteria bacterium]
MTDYIPQAYGFTAIGHLAAAAALRGVRPPLLRGARVLELGCASGGNLIPMAARHPEARFVGVDLSESEILTAQAWSAHHRLENLEWVRADITDWAPEGQFDFILAHGFLSWVPRAVRAALLSRVRAWLAPEGLAVLSHASPPGSGAKELARRIFLAAAPAEGEPEARVQAGKALLAEITEMHGDADHPFAAALRAQHAQLAQAPWRFLVQDIIPPHFEALSLAQVAEESGLGFVGDALPETDAPLGLSPGLQAAWATKRGVEAGDFLDLCVGRGFRRGIWTHPERAAAAGGLRLGGAWLRARFRLAPDWDPNPSVTSGLMSSEGRGLGVRGGPAKQAAMALASRPELPADALTTQLGPAAQAFLEQLLALGGLELASGPRAAETVDAYALAELERGRQLTNPFHQMLTLSSMEASLLRSLAAEGPFIEALVQEALAGRFEVVIGGAPCLDPALLTRVLPDVARGRVGKLVHHGLVGGGFASRRLA